MMKAVSLKFGRNKDVTANRIGSTQPADSNESAGCEFIIEL